MTETVSRSDVRTAIVDAAAALMRDEGPSAVTTRRVAERAGVQAPTIYRLFGDKDGLLDAMAEQVMADFVAAKAIDAAASAAADVDPVEDVRASWHRQIEFGLGNPAVFRLLSDPDRVAGSEAARLGYEVLAARVHRLAAAGRLRIAEPRAIALLQAAGVGCIQTLLATPVGQRDAGLGEAMLEAVLAGVLTDAPAPADHGAAAAAVALRALTPEVTSLSDPERRLLLEWLDRIAAD